MQNKAKANAPHPFPQEVIENSKVGWAVINHSLFSLMPSFFLLLSLFFVDETDLVDVSEALHINQPTHKVCVCI